MRDKTEVIGRYPTRGRKKGVRDKTEVIGRYLTHGKRE